MAIRPDARGCDDGGTAEDESPSRCGAQSPARRPLGAYIAHLVRAASATLEGHFGLLPLYFFCISFAISFTASSDSLELLPLPVTASYLSLASSTTV